MAASACPEGARKGGVGDVDVPAGGGVGGPPGGATTGVNLITRTYSAFQSARPRGGATRRRAPLRLAAGVSIRAPAGGRDGQASRDSPGKAVSIRAPAGGRDQSA